MSLYFTLVMSIICAQNVNSDSDFFLVNKYEGDEYYCVTNTSFALSWIKTDSTSGDLQQTSKFLSKPDLDLWNVNCDSVEDEWNCQNSTSEEIVLDRRWEKMNSSKVNYVTEHNAELQFIMVEDTLDTDFRIPLSIRSSQDAHMLLCDGQSVQASNCYWFILQGFQGTESLIRKCPKGSIPIQNGKKIPSECRKPQETRKHPSEESKFLKKEQWSHVKLSKVQNQITLFDENDTKIISFTDEVAYNITHLFIHSKNTIAFWKKHKLRYILIKNQTTKVFKEPMNSINGNICISTFVKMCRLCKIKFEIRNAEDNEEVIGTFIAESSQWTEVRFTKNNIANKKVLLTVITINDKDEDPFWAIDEINQCVNDGFRAIHLKNMADCQLLKPKTAVLTLNKSVPSTSSNAIEPVECPENTVGNNCVPCEWFLKGQCGKLKICEMYKNENLCSCSAGYRPNVNYHNYCTQDCPKGKYGRHCRQFCLPNCENCDNVLGTCKSCTNHYSGSKCETPPTNFFKTAPVVTKVTYNTVTTHVMASENTNGNAYTFTVQYKEKEDNGPWKSVARSFNVTEEQDITVGDLEPDTQYHIRYVITYHGKLFEDTNIPAKDFATKCDEIIQDDFIVKPKNTTATVVVENSEICQTVCRLRAPQHKIEIQPKTDEFTYHFDGCFIQLFSLLPFQFYRVTITDKTTKKNVIEKSFTTTEGVPRIITVINSSYASATKIRLDWLPSHIFGQFAYYVVSYEVVKYRGCDGEMSVGFNQTTLQEKSNFTVLSDLIPYAKYKIAVYAVNTKFPGPPQTLEVKTKRSDVINDDEIPMLNLFKSDDHSVSLQFSFVACMKIRGSLLIVITALCYTPWCNNKTNEFSYSLSNTDYKFNNLTPFTDYTLTFQYCRNKTICKRDVTTQNFKTSPRPPFPIEQLLVYSKNEHSISVRWKPPYPPTGIFELYKIGLQGQEYTVNVTNSTCDLWPEYQCFTINNLEKNKKYFVEIRAKNVDPYNFGQQTVNSTITRREPSQEPPELKIHWTLENDLLMTWNHPVEANGDIKYFNISVIPFKNAPTNVSVRETLPVGNQYKPTYKHAISATQLQNSVSYKISVAAYNNFDGKPAYIEDTSPPEIPLFEEDPKFKTLNNTIEIETSRIVNSDKENITLFLLVRDNKKSQMLLPTELIYFENNFGIPLSQFKILHQCPQYRNNTRFIIDQKHQNTSSSCKSNFQGASVFGNLYNVTILLMNTNRNKSSYKFKTYNPYNPEILDQVIQDSKDWSLLFLLFLLLIIPIAVIIFIKRSTISNKITSIKDVFGYSSVKTEDDEEETTLTSIDVKKSKRYSKRIKLTGLEQYVKESLKSGELERQHALFPRGQTRPWTYGSLKENKSKNRYTNLVAYDHTRVVLPTIKGKQYSDYINANYIDGYKVDKAYIATQGPKAVTIHDFWRMIWQENVHHIAMLANIYEGKKKKVEKYWPDHNNTLSFGNITINHVSNQVFTDYEHRVFRVDRKGETREVHQYHFSSWPDHGVPLYCQSLIPFLQEIQKIPTDSKSPIVVHCSAGVGRTGTILLCDICLRMAAEEGAVDMLKTLQNLRDQRPNMVDNIQQYKLAHLVILEYLMGKKTGIPCNQISGEVEKLLTSGEIKNQLSYLTETAWQDQTMKSVADKKGLVVVEEKNRIPSIVPEIQGSIFLSRYPITDEASTYINAVTVDGFQCPSRFIVTQQPLPNTVGDFWRLVHEREISIIISLNEINLTNKTCCQFWPTATSNQVKPVDYITLKHANTLSLNFHDLISIHMHINDSEEYKVVEIMALKNWPARINCPKEIEPFLSFYEESNVASRQSKPVIVTCFDGALGSGLYVSLAFMIEKMKLEQICDVCQAVRTVRHNRSQFVQDVEQFEFLYRAAVAYIEGFQPYANFS